MSGRSYVATKGLIRLQKIAMAFAAFLGMWVSSEIALAQSGSGDKEHRIALVIGNSTYLEKPLTNPVNDAALIATTLEQLGFEVVHHKNVRSRQDMFAAAGEFLRRLTPRSVAFFYYAGHGVQIDGRNYLLPTGAVLKYQEDVISKAFDVDYLYKELERKRNPVNVIVLDACRDNPLPKSPTRSSLNGLAVTASPNGSLIAYSTSPNQIATDGVGTGNSPYTRALAEEMARPGLQIESVFKRVAARVSNDTKTAQRPWYHTSLTGELVLNPSGVIISFTKAPVPAGVQYGKDRRGTEEGTPYSEVQSPRWSIGDRWEYLISSSGARGVSPAVEEVVEAGAKRVVVRTTDPRRLIEFDTSLRIIGYEADLSVFGIRNYRYDRPLPFLPFYSSEGNGWDFRGTVTELVGNDQQLLPFELRAQNKGWEEISVTAGSFRALKIELWQRKGSEQPETATYWYAPEVRNIIQEKRTVRLPDSRGGLYTITSLKELSAYSIVGK